VSPCSEEEPPISLDTVSGALQFEWAHEPSDCREYDRLGPGPSIHGNAMNSAYVILIADRNPHVREFLKREMTADGYHVRLAKSADEILQLALSSEHLDLVILDPDLPGVSELALVKILQDKTPSLPIVVHTFLADYVNEPVMLRVAALVEKKGSNVDRLKQVVCDVLRKTYG
jgi:DNA-binding NtrC family response regulator